jgi:hypothetical protein
MGLPSAATGVELYLAAILDELRAVRAAVEGGSPGDGDLADDVQAPASPTKRTRTRTRAGEQR